MSSVKITDMRISVLFLLCICTPFAVFGQAHAQDSSLPAVGSYTEDARTARINDLKTTYRIVLTDKEKELVSSRCVEAQKSLSKIRSRLKSVKSERETTYDSVVSSLTNLKLRFENKQIDPSNLDLLIVSYQQKEANFISSTANYDTALEDAVTIDCVADPIGFRASLEGVRGARKTVVGVSAEIKEITKASLTTTFDSLKLKLLTKEVKSGE